MKDEKNIENKNFVPHFAHEGKVEKKVRIKFLPNRAAEGVQTDADGIATVDAKTAERLIKIKFAVPAESEK